jgi:hypothetical protein
MTRLIVRRLPHFSRMAFKTSCRIRIIPRDRPGTYEAGLPSHKLDYLIMSAQLRTKIKDTGIERRGSYHPNTWEPFDTVTKAPEEDSDHHLVWADFDFGS